MIMEIIEIIEIIEIMETVEIIETPTLNPSISTMKFLENKNGTKTVIVVSVDARIERQTSVVP